MNDDELLRYSRHLLLREIGIEGQEKLRAARALLIGLGGLGSPIALYLAAAGVGELILVDDDRVELSNLQRQIVHDSVHIGAAKTASAAARLRALNPAVTLTLHDKRLSDAELAREVERADVVIDATDNFVTRFQINAACVQAGKPLVFGAAIRLEGQAAVFVPGGACYRCLYQDVGEAAETCSQSGVLAPVVGIIGSIQAAEALKLLAGRASALADRLLLLDAATLETRQVRLRRDPHCPVCGVNDHSR